jgi:hypothetical protein
MIFFNIDITAPLSMPVPFVNTGQPIAGFLCYDTKPKD